MKIFIAILVSIIIGYVLGCLSPAALISKVKHKDLRKHGTKNLGASNTALTFGKKFGVIVMLFDIFKGFLSFKLAVWLFPMLPAAGIIAGLAAVAGHIFPFYMKFKGGKGLATFGGMILAFNPWLFLILLVTGVILIIIVNQSFILPYYAGIVCSIVAAVQTKNVLITVLMICASVLIMWKHYDNLKKAKTLSDIKIRDYIKTHILGIGKMDRGDGHK